MPLPQAQQDIALILMDRTLNRVFRSAREMPTPRNEAIRDLYAGLKAFALGGEMKIARNVVIYRDHMFPAALTEMLSGPPEARDKVRAAHRVLSSHPPCLPLSGIQKDMMEWMITTGRGAQIAKLPDVIWKTQDDPRALSLNTIAVMEQTVPDEPRPTPQFWRDNLPPHYRYYSEMEPPESPSVALYALLRNVALDVGAVPVEALLIHGVELAAAVRREVMAHDPFLMHAMERLMGELTLYRQTYLAGQIPPSTLVVQ